MPSGINLGQLLAMVPDQPRTRKTGTEDIVFGESFAGICDLEVGSDDYLPVGTT